MVVLLIFERGYLGELIEFDVFECIVLMYCVCFWFFYIYVCDMYFLGSLD